MKEEVKPEIQSIQKSGEILAEVTSRIIGPLIVAAVAGPVGAVAGGVAGSIIKYGLEEFMEMWLTPKEVKRVGTSAEYIINEINNSLLNGSILNPKLFEVHNGEMSEAEELFEGVLLKCKTEYQEKKIKLISNIFVNSAFDSTISSTTANQILSLSEGMTYIKLCIISFFGRKDKEFNSTELLDDPYYCYNENKFSADLESLKQDVFELCNQRIIDNNKVLF